MALRTVAVIALSLLFLQVRLARPEPTRSGTQGFQDLIRSPTSPECKNDVLEAFHVASSIVYYNVENVKFAGRLFVDYFKCIGSHGIVTCTKDTVRSYVTIIQQTFTMNFDYIRDLLWGIIKILKSCLSISNGSVLNSLTANREYVFNIGLIVQ